MLKLFLEPSSEFDFLPALRKKVGQLRALDNSKNKFLLISCESQIEAILWTYACFYSNITAVPLSPNLIRNTEIINALGEKTLTTDSVPDAPDYLNELQINSLNDVWAVIHSSGTTGDPKALAFLGSALQGAALAHKEHLQISGLWLLNIPIYHIGGLSILTRALFNNESVGVCGTKFDVTESWHWLRSGVVTGVSLVPTTLYRLLETPAVPHSNLRVALLGGAPANDELVKSAIQRGFPILRTYGMTETCSQVATEKKPLTGLSPLPGVRLTIKEDNELLVHTPYLAAGYFLQGNLKEISNENHYFETGDLGEFTNILNVFGRKKEMIISGGFNIFPFEVESQFAGYEGINEIAVFGMPDSEWGEVVCAAVVSAQKINPNNLRDFLSQRIDRKKIPKFWFQVPTIPKTGTGKVKRSELQKIIEKNFSKH